MRVEVDAQYKITSGWARTCPAPNNQPQVYVFRFDVTSRLDIDCARSYMCQARQLSWESIGTELLGSWVRV